MSITTSPKRHRFLVEDWLVVKDWSGQKLISWRSTEVARHLLEAEAHYRLPVSRLSLAERFEALVMWWRAEVAWMSSPTEMAMHPAYQRIIGLGPQAVPLILAELKSEADHWFWALTA